MNSSHNLALDAQLQYDIRTDRFVAFKIPAPLSVCYKINKECNLACKYCIANSSPKADPGLPTRQASKIIREIANSGIRRLDITGGEPFLREDMENLLDLSVGLGLETVITTNGFGMSASRAKFLHSRGIFTQVSIDGPVEVMRMMRGAGAFEVAVDAVNLLSKYSVDTRINCVLTKHVEIEPSVIMDYICDLAIEMNVGSVYFIVVCAQGRASNRRETLCFSPLEESILRKQIQAKRESDTKLKVKMLDFRRYQRACVLIDTNGDFISQGWSDEDCINTGNVLKQSIQELWSSSDAFDHAIHLLQYIRHPALYE